MVAEWEAAVTQYTELSPHLHYSTSSRRRGSHRATLHGEPWGIVMSSTIEIYDQRFNQEEADGSKFWGPGIYHCVILDEAHRLRMSGTPIGKVRKANGMSIEMDSREYIMHMASCILSLELQYKWMLMASQLANGIEVLRWILHCLESSSWLTPHLPPDTFNYTITIDDDWATNRSNISFCEHHAGFTAVTNLYKTGPDFGTCIQCTTRTWNAYMLPRISEVGKLWRATQSSDIVIRQHHHGETI